MAFKKVSGRASENYRRAGLAQRKYLQIEQGRVGLAKVVAVDAQRAYV